jgi:trimeric autotransporter adhesin
MSYGHWSMYGAPLSIRNAKVPLGNLYIADSASSRIRRVDSNGVITTVAGTGDAGFSGDGGLATAATLNTPRGIVLDSNGILYIADTNNARLRKVAGTGIITTIAGTGIVGNTGDNGQARLARIGYPYALAAGDQGSVYFADAVYSHVRVVTSTGGIYNSVGSGTWGPGGDGQSAALAQLSNPTGLTIDSLGNLIVVDRQERLIRRVTTSTNLISTVAGAGAYVDLGEGGPAISAQLLRPEGLALDSSGNLFVADSLDNRIRRIRADTTIANYAGTGIYGFSGDGAAANQAQLNAPISLAPYPDGGILAGGSYKVRRIASQGGIAAVAGTGGVGSSGDGELATSATFSDSLYVVSDTAGNVYIADSGNNRVRVAGTDKIVRTVAGTGDRGFNGDGQTALTATLSSPSGLAIDSSGNIYVADQGNHRVRRFKPGGTITTVAGDGTAGDSGAEGLAVKARLRFPSALAVDTDGNLYIADSGNYRIKMVTADGVIHNIAGTGGTGATGDGGSATAASLTWTTALAVASDGTLYLAQPNSSIVRKLIPVIQSDRITAAGVVNAASFSGTAVAPGEIVTIFGKDIGPATGSGLAQAADGTVSTSSGGVRVLFDGSAAPVIAANSTQVSTVVPYATSGKSSVKVQVEYLGTPTNTVTVPVSTTAPGVFTATGTGTGQAAALNQDWSVNSATNAAERSSIVMLFVTGEGQTAPAGTDGLIASATLPAPVAPVLATVGGIVADVMYAGAAPGMVAGVMQVNVRIPKAAASGAVPLVLTVGGTATQSGVTLAVR